MEALRHDLLGPESAEEVMTQSPKTRYLVGMLAPRGTEIDVVEDDQDSTAGDDSEASEGQVPLRASLDASSIGVSVVLEPSATPIIAVATWGDYSRRTRAVDVEVDPEQALDLDRDDDPESVRRSKPKEVTEWVRKPQRLEFEIRVGSEVSSGTKEAHGVTLRFLARPLGDSQIVSVFLDNTREAPSGGKRPRDEDYVFQPELVLSGSSAPFLPRRSPSGRIDPDPDIASADLIYRSRLEFATGHGVAVHWDLVEGQTRATRVYTEIIPVHEVPKVAPRESSRLSMDFCSSASRNEVFARLEEMVDGYAAWLNEKETEAQSLPGSARSVGNDHVRLGERSLARMRVGLTALGDDEVWTAFQFANRVMAVQRRRTLQARDKRRNERVRADSEIDANWRPFQMGFILQVLAGLADPQHEDRAVADLLWFPTGGGKTEAYLGLTAIVLALRRLRGIDHSHGGAGTAVIMRYTLRLLTIQQFQRALAMIAACENERLQTPARWGSEPFTIGLWVGQSVTPNSYDDSKAAINKLKRGESVYDKSPFQVLFCPWCGDALSPANYICDDDSERTFVKCFNPECIFHVTSAQHGIPALVVDSEIYRNPPSLLLSTVDKFAQMAWNGRIQSLFGRVDRRCARHGWLSAADDHAATHAESASHPRVVVAAVQEHLPPPELIVQDELHLISGPLGTLVGIYESAVDSLCSYEVAGRLVRPKVVASTATVRRASAQVKALFDRETAIFPPLGLDASDSYFAVEATTEPGRLYVGVFGPGKSIKTTLVRAYAALLGRALYEHTEDRTAESDAYMTLVGYFNSLRELGGAVRLVEDDVRSRLRALKRRGFADDRVIYERRELTSREGSSRIAKTLEALDRTFIDPKQGEYPIDILLSSNMISVGVDIDRLALMVVSGQPKTTAEYIQATSRVGRVHPGLVVQVYNWIRPRDISHYERFHHYHSTFYRHVEATSVTPFSERARDRALAAVLVAHSRLRESDWSQEQGAGRFDSRRTSAQQFAQFMVERSRRVARHGDDVAEELKQQLANKSFVWDQLTKNSGGLVYSSRGQDKAKTRAVLLRQMELNATKGEWLAAGSMREVEPETPVVLKDNSGGG